MLLPGNRCIVQDSRLIKEAIDASVRDAIAERARDLAAAAGAMNALWGALRDGGEPRCAEHVD